MKPESCMNGAHTLETNQKPFYKMGRTTEHTEKTHDWSKLRICKFMSLYKLDFYSCERPLQNVDFTFQHVKEQRASDLSVESELSLKCLSLPF